MRFEHIPAELLHDAWPKVRTGLERVALKGKENWLPEDVYTHLRTKQASLHYGFEGERRIGFFIVEPIKETFTHETLLNVWCLFACAEDGGNFAEVLRFRDEAVAEIDRLAKSMGIKRIRLSGRKGWARVLKEQFTPLRVTYERVLT